MIDLVTNKDIIRMNKVRNMTKDLLDKKELEYYKNKDKETERKIKNFIAVCKNVMRDCDSDFVYKSIVELFPEYFKEN